MDALIESSQLGATFPSATHTGLLTGIPIALRPRVRAQGIIPEEPGIGLRRSLIGRPDRRLTGSSGPPGTRRGGPPTAPPRTCFGISLMGRPRRATVTGDSPGSAGTAADPSSADVQAHTRPWPWVDPAGGCGGAPVGGREGASLP
jgi:hypothetical protein